MFKYKQGRKTHRATELAHRRLNKRITPKPTEMKSIKYKQDAESLRRRDQIVNGQLRRENGLVV